MPRIQIEMPQRFHFHTKIPVRISDINYGNHLGNDAVLSIMHEARLQFLTSLGCTETNLHGVALIQADTAIVYKSEAFYGDVLTVHLTPGDFTRAGFDIYYLLLNQHGNVIATAKTGMVCFDYTARKILPVPHTFKMIFENGAPA